MILDPTWDFAVLPDMADWDEVLGEELQASRRLDEDIAACDAQRTPSTCGCDVESGQAFALPNKPAIWSAVLLKAAGTHLGYEEAGVSTSQSPRLQVLSGCTGCSAESFVLKAGHGSSNVVGT